MNMSRFLFLSCFSFSLSLFSYTAEAADLKMMCGPGSDDSATVFFNPTQLHKMRFSYPTQTIPLKEATTGKGIYWFDLIKCGLVASDKINGYKGGDGRMNFDGEWQPIITSVATEYIDNVTAGTFVGDHYLNRAIIEVPGWPAPYEIKTNHTRGFANSQKYATEIRFKPGVWNIPAGIKLFDFHLFFKLDYAGANDVTYREYISVYTDRDYYIETPTCDFSSANVNLTLDDYDKNSNTKKLVPLTIKCNFDYNVNVKLNGATSQNDSSIFLNTSTINQAKGIGFRFTDLNGNAIRANQNKNYYSPFNQNTSLFYVDYARTNEKLRAGNVQSVINVELSYN